MALDKYQSFIVPYQAHELFSDAQTFLPNLGNSVEELVKELEKKNTKN